MTKPFHKNKKTIRSKSKGMFARLLILMLTIMFCCGEHRAWSNSKTHTAPLTPIPATYFGMHFDNKSNVAAVRPGALGKGTLTMWPYIERSNGNFDWSNLDAWVSTAKKLNIDFVYTFGWTPEWAAKNLEQCVSSGMRGVKRCSSAPTQIGDYDRFVTALATRYKGRIQNYELWNEPEFATAISIEDMAILTQHSHDIIRSIDPAAKIISPSFNAYRVKYGMSYCVENKIRDFDAVSLHVYPDLKYNFAETIDATYRGPNAMLSPLLNVFFGCGFGDKPVWNSEGSWSGHPNLTMTMDEKSSFVSRALLLNWSNGISRLYWYAWDNPRYGRLKGNLAGVAYLETRKWMQGAVMNRPCAPETDASAIWTCGFTRKDGYRAIAVWNTSGSVEISVPSGFSQYRNIAGVRQQIVGKTVEVGPAPILLENEECNFEFELKMEVQKVN